MFAAGNQTWTAASTNATLANATYMGVQGGSATEIADLLEALISGTASNSAVAGFVLAAAQTAAVTPTALAVPNSDGPINPNAVGPATAMKTHVAAGTGPVTYNAANVPIVQLGLNAFGGILRWNAAPTQNCVVVGNVAPAGQWILWNHTGFGGTTTTASAHIMYEPY
jgi:hypothetical protein